MNLREEGAAGDDGSARRQFLTVGATLVGVVAGSAALGLLSAEASARPFVVRPPGAAPEGVFASQCVKCGQCARACPFDAIRIAGPLSGVAPGTPYIAPHQTPVTCARRSPARRSAPARPSPAT